MVMVPCPSLVLPIPSAAQNKVKDANAKEIGTSSSSQVENRKRPSPQDFVDENQTKMQKKSEKAENENIEETITVKLENTENENIEMIEIEEHSYGTMTIPNPRENFG